jgi:GH25 family lysozyme M1 (1,4-beta-N-acetylmuramidase)
VLTVADISHHQGKIDWNVFAPAIDAVIIKAGGGDGRDVPLYEDSMFRRNRDAARRRALPQWYYFFAGCRTSGRREADHFLSLVADARDDEGLALDYEPAVPPPDPTAWCAEFIDRVKLVTGKACLFYTNEDRVLTQNWGPVVDTCGGLWVAKYGKDDGFPHTPPKTGQWPRATAWQYTSKKRMPGVTENTVDMNQFFGDVAQFRAHGSAAFVALSGGFADMGEDQLRKLVREATVEALNSKARRVRGITSWERYLEVLLDASRKN